MGLRDLQLPAGRRSPQRHPGGVTLPGSRDRRRGRYRCALFRGPERAFLSDAGLGRFRVGHGLRLPHCYLRMASLSEVA